MTSLDGTYSNSSYEWQEAAQLILIVDDEVQMRASLKLLLEGEDRVVLEAATGHGAIEILLHPQNLWVTTGSGSFPSV